MDMSLLAFENEDQLSKNIYPGRGIVIGMTPDAANFVQVYWIMGRSDNSRNRVFAKDGDFVRTKAHDESKLSDPSLIIYYPVRSHNEYHIVSNGDQTDTVFEYLKKGQSSEAALSTRCYEPDGPNYTPRITGIVNLSDKSFSLSILKKLAGTEGSLREFFNYEKGSAGFGYCIHTYRTDGNPLPSFNGEPYITSIRDSIEANADHYWGLLDQDNRISILVKYINVKTGAVALKIINRHG